MGNIVDCGMVDQHDEHPPHQRPQLRDSGSLSWKKKKHELFQAYSHELPIPEEQDETREVLSARDSRRI